MPRRMEYNLSAGGHISRETLHYAPVLHARRQAYWQRKALPTAILAALLAGILVCFRSRMSPDVQVFAVVCIALFVCISLLDLVNWRRAWECRVEGRTLLFRRPFDRGWATIQFDELREVVQLRDAEGDWDYELVFAGGQRILLPKSLFGGFAEFERQMARIHPGIQFGKRRTSECPNCGRGPYGPTASRALRVALRTRRCDHCGARLPGRLRPIPQGGLLLPDALDW